MISDIHPSRPEPLPRSPAPVAEAVAKRTVQGGAGNAGGRVDWMSSESARGKPDREPPVAPPDFPYLKPLTGEYLGKALDILA